eukprot:2286698-Pleurochrysis_carterae.AAC.4
MGAQSDHPGRAGKQQVVCLFKDQQKVAGQNAAQARTLGAPTGRLRSSSAQGCSGGRRRPCASVRARFPQLAWEAER